jgi:hypothetical protein
MSSIGDSGGPESVGGADASLGGGNTADENVTHTRGRIDDMIRNLNIIRRTVDEANWGGTASMLDAADEWIEKATEHVLDESDA